MVLKMLNVALDTSKRRVEFFSFIYLFIIYFELNYLCDWLAARKFALRDIFFSSRFLVSAKQWTPK